MPKPYFFTLAALLMMSSWAMAAPLACQSYGIVKDAGIDHVLSSKNKKISVSVSTIKWNVLMRLPL